MLDAVTQTGLVRQRLLERASALQVAVQRPFEAQLPEARERLMQLLRHTTIRASKDDLEIMVRRTHKVGVVAPACLSCLSVLSRREGGVLHSSDPSGLINPGSWFFRVKGWLRERVGIRGAVHAGHQGRFRAQTCAELQ